MIKVIKRPLLIDGITYKQGDVIPPAIFNAQPSGARHRWITSKEVESDFKDGEEHAETMSVGQQRASTIIGNDTLIRELREVGCEVPNGVSERLLFLVHNVVISGRDINEAAAQHHAMALLPDWVPDDFRASIGMNTRRPRESRLSGARQDVLEGMLDHGVEHTTQENLKANESERIPEDEQVHVDPLHLEQLQTLGDVIPAGNSKKNKR